MGRAIFENNGDVTNIIALSEIIDKVAVCKYELQVQFLQIA